MLEKEKLMKIGLWLCVLFALFTGLLFLPFIVFIGFPWLAIIIGAGFVLAWFKWREIWLVVTGALWLLYAGYEYMMHLRIWCSGECNIRIDLLVIFPLLVYCSVCAIKAVRKQKTENAL